MKMDSPAVKGHRAIRVFVSSTFRDMHAERDGLVKHVFPRLRKLCEERGVTWGEVDLRWGVTEEQRAEGKVLPICLEEIRRCRPYFIGILGNRYGWVPETIPRELMEQEPWLSSGRGRSVTELEILHGALNDPSTADHAFFYFRSPKYADGLEAETLENARKLQALKDRVRVSKLSLHEDYADPKAFGGLVEADLRAVIEREFPITKLDPLDQEWADHEAYAQHRCRVYVGRPDYFSALDAHAAGDGAPLVVLGESGLGKSALLANWAAAYRKKNPNQFVLQHFVGVTRASADWASLVGRIMGEFERRLHISLGIPTRTDLLYAEFANALGRVAAKQRVVILLDALNQLEDRDGAPDLVWLPAVLPPNVRLAVSTLPGRSLDELQKRGWPVLQVEPLTVEERKRLVADYLRQFSRKLEESRIARIAGAPQSGNPLYLGALLEELRVFGVYELLDQQIAYYLEAQNASELYTRILARWERDYEEDRPGWVREALSMLWAARRGLSESELREALGDNGAPLPHALWSGLYLAAGHALLNRSGLVGPAHDHLRQAVRTKWLASEEERRAAHREVAGYFSSEQPGTDRALDEIPWQFMCAGEWEKLRDFLTSPDLLERLWEKDAQMVRRYWHEVEAHSAFRLVDSYAELLEESPTADKFPAQTAAASLLREFGFAERSLAWCRKARLLTASRSQSYRNALTKLEISVLQDRGDFKAVIPLLDSLISSGGSDNKSFLAICLMERGSALNSLGQYDAGLTDLKRAEELAKEIGDPRLIAKVALERATGVLHLGAVNSAEQQLREAERASREGGDNLTLAATLDTLGSLYMLRGNLDTALRMFEEELTTCDECSDQVGLARALTAKGNVLGRMSGDPASVFRLFDEAQELCRQTLNPIGEACAIGSRGRFLRKLGRFSDALECQTAEAAIWREIDAPGFLAACLLEQCLTHHMAGATQEAKRCFDSANAILDRLGTPHVQSVDQLAEAVLKELPVVPDMQTVQLAYSNPAEAEAAEQRLLKAVREDGLAHGEVSARLWKHRMELGNLLQLRGRLSEATDQLSQALTIAQKLFPDHQNTSANLNLLAVTRIELGEWQEAERLLRQALEIDSHTQPKWSEARARTLGNLGIVLMRQGRLADSEAYYREALAILERIMPAEHESLAIPLSGLGCVLDDSGKKEESERLHRRALAIDLRVFGPNHPRMATRHHNLGCLLQSVGRLAEARECFEKVLEIDRKVEGTNSRVAVKDMLRLANLSAKIDDFQGAAARLVEAADALQAGGESEKELCFDVLMASGPIARKLPRAEGLALVKITLACAQRAYAGDGSETGQMVRRMIVAGESPADAAEAEEDFGKTRQPSQDNVPAMLKELTRCLVEGRPAEECDDLLRRALHLRRRSQGRERRALTDLLNYAAYCRQSSQDDPVLRGVAALKLPELAKGAEPSLVDGNLDLQHAASLAWSEIAERAIRCSDWEFAMNAAESSLELLRGLVQVDSSNANWLSDYAQALTLKGELELERGGPKNAKQAFELAKAEHQRLVRLHPGKELYLRNLAVTCDKLGDTARAEEDFDAATAAYAQALPAFREASRVDPAFLRDLSLCLAKVGELALAQEDFTAAKQALEEHFSLAKKIANASPDQPEHQRDLAGAHGRMAQLAMAAGNMPDAVAHTQAAHEIVEAVALTDPSNARWQQDLAGSFFNLGMLLSRTGDVRQGAKMVGKSYKLLRDMDRADQLDVRGRKLLQHLRSMVSRTE